MIMLTNLDGTEIYLNPDLLETMIEDADTHLKLSNGRSYLVRESCAEVTRRIVAYRQECAAPSPSAAFSGRRSRRSRYR